MTAPTAFLAHIRTRFNFRTLAHGLALLSCLVMIPMTQAEPTDEQDTEGIQLRTLAPTSVENESFSPQEVLLARRVAFNNRSSRRVSSRGYIWPIQGAVLSPYGPRGGRIHPGVDIDGPMGAPVSAARAGMVMVAGPKYSGYGNMVDILHEDGTITRYAHATRVIVHVGQQVEQGQPIMTLGCTGRCTGPHVHFEVRLGGHSVNPMPYLR